MVNSAEPLPLRIRDPKGWVLYDGQCGICRMLAFKMEPTLKRAGFSIAPLQAEWVIDWYNKVFIGNVPTLEPNPETPVGQSADELAPEEFIVIDKHGAPHLGADGHRAIFKEVWWLKPLYWLSLPPIAHWIFNRCYRLVADNRHRISSTCRLNNKAQ